MLSTGSATWVSAHLKEAISAINTQSFRAALSPATSRSAHKSRPPMVPVLHTRTPTARFFLNAGFQQQNAGPIGGTLGSEVALRENWIQLRQATDSMPPLGVTFEITLGEKEKLAELWSTFQLRGLNPSSITSDMLGHYFTVRHSLGFEFAFRELYAFPTL